MARVGRAMAGVGGTWARVLLAAGLWAFAWVYAQPPPPSEAVAVIRMHSPPTFSADLAADDSGHESATEIAKQVENPISDVSTSPLQNDTSSGSGSRSDTQDILNVQPVIPIHLTEDWRTALPSVWSPSSRSEPSVPPGPEAAMVSVILTPHKPIDGWLPGGGPIVQVPTITSNTPGSDAWDAGPAFVVGKPAGPIVAGAYVNNMTLPGGMSGHGAAGGAARVATGYGPFIVNPPAGYSFGNGWFVCSAPTFAADELPDGAKWMLPVGAQVGRVVEIDGKLPVALLVGVYYDALRSQFGSRWQLRTTAAFMF